MPPQKRPKSFISTAQNVVQNLIGVKDKSNSSSKCLKVYCPAKKQLLYSPSHEEVQLCHCIMQQANEFIKKELIHYLPAEPIYLNKDKQILDFMFMSDAMIKSKGYDDSFLKKFSKTQLFTYYLETHYGARKRAN